MDTLFRNTIGSDFPDVFDNIHEAGCASINSAASSLFFALKVEGQSYSLNGDALLEKKAELKKLMKELSAALDGKRIATYVLKK